MSPAESLEKPDALPADKPARPKPGAAFAHEDESELLVCVDAIRRKDQHALARLYELTISRTYGVALRIVRQQEVAEDVISEVYMQVWRDADRYDPSRGRVLGWLLIIARSRALDALRRQDEAFCHPAPYDLVAEPETNGRDDPQNLMLAAETGTALHAALEALTPIQRQLVALAFFRGLSHSEIVIQTRIPLGSVKTHIRRALAVLRTTLGPDAVKWVSGARR